MFRPCQRDPLTPRSGAFMMVFWLQSPVNIMILSRDRLMLHAALYRHQGYAAFVYDHARHQSRRAWFKAISTKDMLKCMKASRYNHRHRRDGMSELHMLWV